MVISLALASGTVRSFKGLQPWLQDNTKGTHTRYASSLLHSIAFQSRKMNCTPTASVICPKPSDFLHERLGMADPDVIMNIFMNCEYFRIKNVNFFNRKPLMLLPPVHLQLVWLPLICFYIYSLCPDVSVKSLKTDSASYYLVIKA